MREIITLRMMLNARYPKGSKMEKVTNVTNYTAPKKKRK